ncbi:MAG TPA: hypothetical protein ENN69_06595 [Spirochaetia bacterium]|nr:hypothetical protein [Spirochaetia bacterium]
MPLGAEATGDYCQYCADGSGVLKPYEEVRAGIAQWLSSWTPETVKRDPTARAEAYMRAMPAWADR